MINANELRIGNFIYRTLYKGHAYNEENGHDFKDIIHTVDINTISAIVRGATHYKPIPLTPEILESCGFNKNLDFPNNSFYSLNMNNSKSYFLNVVLDNEYSTDTPIEYLHQLQNLYFALTNQELNVNLNVATIL